MYVVNRSLLIWAVGVLFILRLLPVSAAGLSVAIIEHADVVAQTGDETQPAEFSFRLAREIVRQSVQVALRDECGFVTSDQVLRQESNLADPGFSVAFHIRHIEAKGTQATVVFDGLGEFQAETTESWPEMHAWPKLVSQWSEISRKQLTEWLDKQGVERRERPEHVAAELPAEIDRSLSRVNLVHQLYAVRLLHKHLREHGDSALLLASLSRAYANLGQLTRWHLQSHREVFVARSLLYADRAASLFGDIPETRYISGYAWSLAGFGALGLQAYPHEPESDDPAWARAGYYFAKYELSKLKELATKENRDSELYAVLACALAEQIDRARPVDWVYAVSDAKRHKNNPRIYQGMPAAGAVVEGFLLDYQESYALSRMIDHDLLALPGFPEHLVEQVTPIDQTKVGLKRRGEICAALMREGLREQAREDLSWSEIGSVLYDAHAASIFRGLLYQDMRVGANRQEEKRRYREEASESFDEHPFAGLLSVAFWPEQAAHEPLVYQGGNPLTIFENVNLTNGLSDEVWGRFAPLSASEVRSRSSSDATPSDNYLAWLACHVTSTRGQQAIFDFVDIAGPLDHPAYLAQAIHDNPALSYEDAMQQAKPYLHFAPVLRAMIVASAHNDDLEYYLLLARKHIKSSPDYDGLIDYLRVLERHDRLDEGVGLWLEWIEASPASVGRSNMISDLARYYFNQGKIEQAVAHAAVAAESFSWDSLNTLAMSLEQAGESEQAMMVAFACDENYFQWRGVDQFTGLSVGGLAGG